MGLERHALMCLVKYCFTMRPFFIVFVDLITNVTFDLVFVICVFICKMEFLQV